MTVKLRIKKLYDAAWNVFRFQYNLAVADRDDYQSRMKHRLDQKVASEIQLHVDAAIGRIQVDGLPNPQIMTKREFYELLALEKTIEEIADRIEANAKFSESGSLLPTLGLSWQEDILPLINGQQSPGYMPLENVKKFLGMVRNAEQQLPVDSAEVTADHFRKLRRELIGFWKKP